MLDDIVYIQSKRGSSEDLRQNSKRRRSFRALRPLMLNVTEAVPDTRANRFCPSGSSIFRREKDYADCVA